MIQNGMIAFDILSIDNFPIFEAINKHCPTGGVVNPIIKLKQINIPMCTGCIPISFNAGNNIGVKIKTEGMGSMNVPINKRKTFNNSSNNILLSEKATK